MEYACQDFSSLTDDIPKKLAGSGVYSRILGGYAQHVALAANIKRLRRDAGLTQAGIGSSLGVGQGAVSKWEAGETQPEVSALPSLAMILGCSLNDLLRGVNPAYDLVRHSAGSRSAASTGGAGDPSHQARLLEEQKQRITALETALSETRRHASEIVLVATTRLEGHKAARRKPRRGSRRRNAG